MHCCCALTLALAELSCYIMLCSPLVTLQWHRNRWLTIDHFALKSVSGSATNELAFLAFGQNCSKICRAIPIYCQRKKCSTENLVSSKVRLMWIFAGFAGERASSRKWQFSLLWLAISYEPSHSRPQLLYCTTYIGLIDTETDDLEWPWMVILRQNVFRFGI